MVSFHFQWDGGDRPQADTAGSKKGHGEAGETPPSIHLDLSFSMQRRRLPFFPASKMKVQTLLFILLSTIVLCGFLEATL